MGHRPMFSSAHPDSFKDLLAGTWHSLFVNASVDVVLTSHHHCYERLCAVQDATSCAEHRDRPVYIVEGIAGAEFSPSSTPPSVLAKYKDFDQWGYSRFHVSRSLLNFTHYHTDNKLVDGIALPASALFWSSPNVGVVV